VKKEWKISTGENMDDKNERPEDQAVEDEKNPPQQF